MTQCFRTTQIRYDVVLQSIENAESNIIDIAEMFDRMHNRFLRFIHSELQRFRDGTVFYPILSVMLFSNVNIINFISRHIISNSFENNSRNISRFKTRDNYLQVSFYFLFIPFQIMSSSFSYFTTICSLK